MPFRTKTNQLITMQLITNHTYGTLNMYLSQRLKTFNLNSACPVCVSKCYYKEVKYVNKDTCYIVLSINEVPTTN